MVRKFRFSAPKNHERKRKKASIGRPKKKIIGRKKCQEECSLDSLHESLTFAAETQWIDHSSISDGNISICKILNQGDNSQESLIVTHSLVVKDDLSWTLTVHGKLVNPSNCSHLSSIPAKLSAESIANLIAVVDRCSICPGHPDENFLKMLEDKKGKLMSKNQGEISTIDNHSPVQMNGRTFSKTVRHSKCQMLVSEGKCSTCVKYRNSLRRIYHRWSKKKLSPRCREGTNSHTNFRHLNTPEKCRRYRNLRRRLLSTEKEVEKLKQVIEASNEKHGVKVGESVHADLSNIMEEMSGEILEKYPVGSFRRVFWEQQLEAVRKKDRRQIRWHPAIIKWCLHLKFISSGAYHALRSSLLVLPSERTLRDYTHVLKRGVGFLPDVTAQLVSEADIHEDKDRYVVLMWDEMKIKDLVFDKHTCELIGFANAGEINNHLDSFERQCNNPTQNGHPNVATHMLMFMVRGIFTSLEFPYAQFPTRDASADTLFPIVWDAVAQLERAGLKVVAFACDGASTNRKFYRMHGGEGVYKTLNPYSDEERDIYFFADVPHLMKTTRNCWSNSFAHRYTRCLWNDGKYISWLHLQNMFDNDQRISGLKLLPKLKREHIKLSSYSRMRVYLAVQVLSSSVGSALSFYEDPETTETQKFVQMFDRFFDCLNVRCTAEGVQKRKPDLRPYRDPCDSRLNWLENVFLQYLLDWEENVSKREGSTKAQQNQMLLSKETREGIRMTVHSFIELSKVLLGVPGVQYLLSEKFCQDPIESFFGKQRARGGRNENPTAKQFMENTVSLRVQGSSALEPTRGNCRKRGRTARDVVDSSRLPKRKRYSARRKT